MIPVGETIPIKINNIQVDVIVEIVTEEFGSLYVSKSDWEAYKETIGVKGYSFEQVRFANNLGSGISFYHFRYWYSGTRSLVYIISMFSSEEEYIKYNFCFGMN